VPNTTAHSNENDHQDEKAHTKVSVHCMHRMIQSGLHGLMRCNAGAERWSFPASGSDASCTDGRAKRCDTDLCVCA